MKKFLIIGNANAIIDKIVFPLIKDNKIWLGTQYVKEFVSDSSETKKFGNIRWFTNLDHNKRHSPIVLTQSYSSDRYPKYDNYSAIDVNKVADIPLDYDGAMGVPVSFMDKYCPEQFEIIWRGGDIEWAKNNCSFYTPPSDEQAKTFKKQNKTWRIQNPYLLDKDGNAKSVFSRILIRFKKMKKFLIIGNFNAVQYKDIFPLIKGDNIWLGISKRGMDFITSEGLKIGINAVWFTNMGNNSKRTLELTQRYDPDKYPKYDNYDAIEVSRIKDIPYDYDGVMGVPITFLDKYCPEQFEILGITENADYLKPLYVEGCKKYDRPYLSGKRMYSRMLIRLKKKLK